MTEQERELGLQLGAANAELRSQAKEIEALKADAEMRIARLTSALTEVLDINNAALTPNLQDYVRWEQVRGAAMQKKEKTK